MRRTDMTVTNCGIRVAGTSETETLQAIQDLRNQIDGTPVQHLIVLFSINHKPAAVCRAVESAFPGVAYSGCTTAGEFGPHGMSDNGIVMIAFPRGGFSLCARVLHDIEDFGAERATNTVRTMRANLLQQPHRSNTTHNGSNRQKQIFALLLIDGLSNMEEMLVAAINWAMGDLQLIGGSSGDRLSYGQSSLIQNGTTYQNAALLLLVETCFPFEAFRTQDFSPSTTKFVVTAADPENRTVYELNAEPAALEYARALGLTREDLGHYVFADRPMGVRIADEYFCRSVKDANADHSLSFFCAIDEGLVLTLAEPQDLLLSTDAALRDLDAKLNGLDLVIGFDCILRRLSVERRQAKQHLESTYQKHRVVGFHTYGEQFNAMHLNQTFTGIAFGTRQLAN